MDLDPNKWKITRLIPLVCLYLAQSGQSLAPVKENVNQALEIKVTKLNVTCQIPLIVGLHAALSCTRNFTLGRLVSVLSCRCC